jgi:hypothetical protein
MTLLRNLRDESFDVPDATLENAKDHVGDDVVTMLLWTLVLDAT